MTHEADHFPDVRKVVGALKPSRAAGLADRSNMDETTSEGKTVLDVC
jgi:hypothetical protein